MTFLEEHKDNYFIQKLDKYSLESTKSPLADETKPLCLIFIKFCELARVIGQLKEHRLKELASFLAAVPIDTLVNDEIKDYIFQSYLKVLLQVLKTLNNSQKR